MTPEEIQQLAARLDQAGKLQRQIAALENLFQHVRNAEASPETFGVGVSEFPEHSTADRFAVYVRDTSGNAKSWESFDFVTGTGVLAEMFSALAEILDRRITQAKNQLAQL